MERELFNNVQFDYLENENSRQIISGLKTHDGYALHHPKSRISVVCGDVEKDVYFIEAHLSDWKLERTRREGIRNKYKEVYQFVRNVSEFVLLVQGRQAHVLVNESRYQDGVSIKLLEICTKDFEMEEISQLRIITKKAMNFIYNGEGVPEYSYTDAGAMMTCEKDNL